VRGDRRQWAAASATPAVVWPYTYYLETARTKSTRTDNHPVRVRNRATAAGEDLDQDTDDPYQNGGCVTTRTTGQLVQHDCRALLQPNRMRPTTFTCRRASRRWPDTVLRRWAPSDAHRHRLPESGPQYLQVCTAALDYRTSDRWRPG